MKLLISRESPRMIVKVIEENNTSFTLEILALPKSYCGDKKVGDHFKVHNSVAKALERKIWAEIKP